MHSPLSHLDIARDLVRRLAKLPTLDETATRLLAASRDEAVDAHNVRIILETDLTLVTRVLKVANSAYYRRSGRVGSIEQAIVLLGMDAVRNIAVASSLERIVRAGPIPPNFHVRDLWRHSISTAIYAQAIALQCEPELRDQAFLAGLLHDIGILLEIELQRQLFITVVEHIDLLRSTDRGSTLMSLERRLLGAAHSDFGAALLEQWDFPASLVQAVATHHPACDSAATRLGDMIHAADHISAFTGAGIAFELNDSPDEAVLERLDQPWDGLKMLATSLRPQVEEMSNNLAA